VRLKVIVERDFGDDASVIGKDNPTDLDFRKQLAKELQIGWNEAEIAGSFDVVSVEREEGEPEEGTVPPLPMDDAELARIAERDRRAVLNTLEAAEAELHNHVTSDLSWMGVNDETVDVRLQVLEDGTYTLHTGDASYDTDHRGFWGSGTLTRPCSPQDRIDLAKDLVAQVLEHAAQ
jgi:hypothetical protein